LWVMALTPSACAAAGTLPPALPPLLALLNLSQCNFTGAPACINSSALCAGPVLTLVSAALLLYDAIARAAARAVEECAPSKGRL